MDIVATVINDRVAYPREQTETLRGEELVLSYRINTADAALARDAMGLPARGAPMPPPAPPGLVVTSISFDAERGAARNTIATVRGQSAELVLQLDAPGAEGVLPAAYTEVRSSSQSVQVREAYNDVLGDTQPLPLNTTLSEEVGSAELVVHNYFTGVQAISVFRAFVAIQNRHNASDVTLPPLRHQGVGSRIVAAADQLMARSIRLRSVRPEYVAVEMGFAFAPAAAVIVRTVTYDEDGFADTKLWRPQGKPVQ